MNEQHYVVRINENGANFLYNASKWLMIQIIFGYIFSGVFMFVSLGFIFGATLFSAFANLMPIPLWIVGIIYFAISLYTFFICFKLHRFSRNAKLALTTNNDSLLETSLKNLNDYAKLVGILMLVLVILYAFAFAAVLSASFFK